MGKWVKIGIIMGIIILFFFLVSILPTNPPKTQEKSLEQQTADATIKTISSEKITSNQKVVDEKPTTMPEQNSEVQVNIKDALETWSNDLPTEYTLGEIRSYCKEGLPHDCYPSQLLNISTMEEGYTRSFGGWDGGEGSVYRFKTSNEAKIQFDRIIQNVKDERGYTEIIISDNNCFGWKKSFPNIVCYKSNVIYNVQQAGLLSTSDFESFTEQLGELLT